MLVEQLVWAVGTKGNISGHASSLLLQLLTTATREVLLRVIDGSTRGDDQEWFM